jgi:adenosylcobinamide kinase/adenosylcobinamide-phosphate guanylyltransferase
MLTLILGGARSGKSDLAERLAAASGRDVLFVATMERGDAEMGTRIDAHRAARPAAWRTVEEPLDVLGVLRGHARPGGFVLLDCMTLWVSNMLIARLGDAETARPAAVRDAIDAAAHQARAFAAWARGYDGEVAAVSNEAGMGLVPPYPLGRAFRDALGAANRVVAREADQVYFLLAGLALELKSLGAQPIESLPTEPRR